MTPTAEEFIKDGNEGYNFRTVIDNLTDEQVLEAIREFAKLHVEAALKSAAEKVTMELTYPSPYEDSNEQGLTYANADEVSRGGEYGSIEVEKQSILNAYPLENIK